MQQKRIAATLPQDRLRGTSCAARARKTQTKQIRICSLFPLRVARRKAEIAGPYPRIGEEVGDIVAPGYVMRSRLVSLVILRRLVDLIKEKPVWLRFVAAHIEAQAPRLAAGMLCIVKRVF